MQSPIAQLEVTDFDRALLNRAFKTGVALGRKFEASDMTIELRNAAKLYASIYRPTDEGFMADMYLRAISGFLSDGQSKGVLNVMMADARRRLAARAPVAVGNATGATSLQPQAQPLLAAVPDGRYRVTLPDGDHLALLIRAAGKDSKLAGSRIVSTRINGDEWMGVAHINGEFRLWRSCAGALRDRVSAAVKALDTAARDEQGWLIAGLAFAQEGSQCFICGRDLDTPESLTAGYGPVCADKHGLPWGAKAIPMSVRLAQAAQAASETVAIDPETGVEESADELLALVKQTAPVQTTPAATSIKQEVLPLDPSELATDGRPLSRYQRDQREGRPRPAGGYSYEDVFGEDD